MSSLRVECTWGDGPDIIVSLNGNRLICLSPLKDFDKFTGGVIDQGQFDLTKEEARTFAKQLLAAADEVSNLEQEYELAEAQAAIQSRDKRIEELGKKFADMLTYAKELESKLGIKGE